VREPERISGGLGAEAVRLIAGDAREAQRGARVERLLETLGIDVEMAGVGVVEARRDVVPVVAQGGRQLLLGGDRDQRIGGQQVEQLAEAVDGQQLGDVGTLVAVLGGHVGGGDLGQLAMLWSQLRGGGDLDPLDLLERALGEGREEGQPLDLDVEQLAAHGALLGRRIDVEDVAAQRELATLLDLLDALVAAGDELRRGLVEIEQAAPLDREAVRAQLRVRDLLGERDGAGDDDRRSGVSTTAVGSVDERVERRDPQADEVRRRHQVGLVADAARRVEADRPRREELLEVGRQVARGAVVAGHHERRAVGLGVEQRGEQVGAHALRHEGPLRRLAGSVGERRDGLVLLGVCEQWAQ